MCLTSPGSRPATCRSARPNTFYGHEQSATNLYLKKGRQLLPIIMLHGSATAIDYRHALLHCQAIAIDYRHALLHGRGTVTDYRQALLSGHSPRSLRRPYGITNTDLTYPSAAIRLRYVLLHAQLTFRHRASCILGQVFHYSPENAFYVFNQQIYFIV